MDKGELVTPAPLAPRLGNPGGPLFFPVTAYGADGTIAPDPYRLHGRRGGEAGPAAVFACHRALRAGDRATVDRLLDGFHRPFAELRDQGPGCAVSPVKAGARLRGPDVGEVRPPLNEPSGDHVDQLARLIERGIALLEEAK